MVESKIKVNSFFNRLLIQLSIFLNIIWLSVHKVVSKIFFLKNSLFDFSKIRFWNKFFVILYACIIWLCLISILGSSVLERILNPTKFASKASVVIEIYPENTKEKTNSKTQVVTKYLDSLSYVKQYEVVSENKIRNMLDSFSSFADNAELPLPVVINAQLYEVDDNILLDLTTKLKQKVNNIYVDTEKDLLDRLAQPLNTVQIVTTVIPLMAVIILVSIIFLTMYAILFSNKRTIEVLVFLGALKKDIYNEFALWTLNKSFKGCILGGILGIITSLAAIFFLHFSFSLVPWFYYLLFVVVIVIVLPLLSSIMSMIFVNKILNRSFKN